MVIVKIYALVIFGVICFVAGRYLPRDESCPRMIKGYECRGNNCDHSERAVTHAWMQRYKMGNQKIGDE